MIKTQLPILMSASGNLQTIVIDMRAEGEPEENIQKVEDARQIINLYINPGL